MNKKCLFLFLLFVVRSKSDGGDFLRYFSDFAESFFKNVTEIEHVDASVPGFQQIKDVEYKTIEELTKTLQDELLKQLQSQVPKDAIVVTDNPKTQIYVKTFSHFFDDFEPVTDEEVSQTYEVKPLQVDYFSFLQDLNKNNAENETLIEKVKENVNNIESRSSVNQSSDDEKTTVDDTSIMPTLKDEVTESLIPTQKINEQNELLTQKEQINQNNTEKISDSISNIKEQNPATQKQFEKDIRDNIIETDDNDYDVEDATDYPQIDYIDLYKDTTNEENVYVTDRPNIDINDEIVEKIEEYSLEIVALDNDNSTNICHGNTSDIANIYPWIATIFIKNDTSNQFQYTCDGALLSAKLLLTAARCVINNNTVKPDDVLVFLGKTSLQSIGVDEKNVRISDIKIHSNFSVEGEQVVNDLALLALEEPVVFSDSIRPACLGGDGVEGRSATTSWDLSGALKPVFFEKNNDDCPGQKVDGTFCATYGNNVALCPSHGGLFASQHASRWFLEGIQSDDPGYRGLCFKKTVVYTPIANHMDWIMENME